MLTDDRRLTQKDIEDMTGIEPGHPNAQANQLKRQGIKCYINAKREVVVWQSWIQMAGMKELVIHFPAPDSKAQNDELVLDFDKLDGLDSGRHKKKKTG